MKLSRTKIAKLLKTGNQSRKKRDKQKKQRVKSLGMGMGMGKGKGFSKDELILLPMNKKARSATNKPKKSFNLRYKTMKKMGRQWGGALIDDEFEKAKKIINDIDLTPVKKYTGNVNLQKKSVEFLNLFTSNESKSNQEKFNLLIELYELLENINADQQFSVIDLDEKVTQLEEILTKLKNLMNIEKDIKIKRRRGSFKGTTTEVETTDLPPLEKVSAGTAIGQSGNLYDLGTVEDLGTANKPILSVSNPMYATIDLDLGNQSIPINVPLNNDNTGKTFTTLKDVTHTLKKATFTNNDGEIQTISVPTTHEELNAFLNEIPLTSNIPVYFDPNPEANNILRVEFKTLPVTLKNKDGTKRDLKVGNDATLNSLNLSVLDEYIYLDDNSTIYNSSDILRRPNNGLTLINNTITQEHILKVFFNKLLFGDLFYLIDVQYLRNICDFLIKDIKKLGLIKLLQIEALKAPPQEKQDEMKAAWNEAGGGDSDMQSDSSMQSDSMQSGGMQSGGQWATSYWFKKQIEKDSDTEAVGFPVPDVTFGKLPNHENFYQALCGEGNAAEYDAYLKSITGAGAGADKFKVFTDLFGKVDNEVDNAVKAATENLQKKIDGFIQKVQVLKTNNPADNSWYDKFTNVLIEMGKNMNEGFQETIPDMWNDFFGFNKNENGQVVKVKPIQTVPANAHDLFINARNVVYESFVSQGNLPEEELYQVPVSSNEENYYSQIDEQGKYSELNQGSRNLTDEKLGYITVEPTSEAETGYSNFNKESNEVVENLTYTDTSPIPRGQVTGQVGGEGVSDLLKLIKKSSSSADEIEAQYDLLAGKNEVGDIKGKLEKLFKALLEPDYVEILKTKFSSASADSVFKKIINIENIKFNPPKKQQTLDDLITAEADKGTKLRGALDDERQVFYSKLSFLDKRSLGLESEKGKLNWFKRHLEKEREEGKNPEKIEAYAAGLAYYNKKYMTGDEQVSLEQLKVDPKAYIKAMVEARDLWRTFLGMDNKSAGTSTAGTSTAGTPLDPSQISEINILKMKYYLNFIAYTFLNAANPPALNMLETRNVLKKVNAYYKTISPLDFKESLSGWKPDGYVKRFISQFRITSKVKELTESDINNLPEYQTDIDQFIEKFSKYKGALYKSKTDTKMDTLYDLNTLISHGEFVKKDVKAIEKALSAMRCKTIEDKKGLLNKAGIAKGQNMVLVPYTPPADPTNNKQYTTDDIYENITALYTDFTVLYANSGISNAYKTLRDTYDMKNKEQQVMRYFLTLDLGPSTAGVDTIKNITTTVTQSIQPLAAQYKNAIKRGNKGSPPAPTDTEETKRRKIAQQIVELAEDIFQEAVINQKNKNNDTATIEFQEMIKFVKNLKDEQLNDDNKVLLIGTNREIKFLLREIDSQISNLEGLLKTTTAGGGVGEDDAVKAAEKALEDLNNEKALIGVEGTEKDKLVKDQEIAAAQKKLAKANAAKAKADQDTDATASATAAETAKNATTAEADKLYNKIFTAAKTLKDQANKLQQLVKSNTFYPDAKNVAPISTVPGTSGVLDARLLASLQGQIAILQAQMDELNIEKQSDEDAGIRAIMNGEDSEKKQVKFVVDLPKDTYFKRIGSDGMGLNNFLKGTASGLTAKQIEEDLKLFNETYRNFVKVKDELHKVLLSVPDIPPEKKDDTEKNKKELEEQIKLISNKIQELSKEITKLSKKNGQGGGAPVVPLPGASAPLPGATVVPDPLVSAPLVPVVPDTNVVPGDTPVTGAIVSAPLVTAPLVTAPVVPVVPGDAPDASATLPDASATLPDASATLPDASATLPDASATLPGASALVPGDAPDASATDVPLVTAGQVQATAAQVKAVADELAEKIAAKRAQAMAQASNQAMATAPVASVTEGPAEKGTEETAGTGPGGPSSETVAPAGETVAPAGKEEKGTTPPVASVTEEPEIKGTTTPVATEPVEPEKKGPVEPEGTQPKAEKETQVAPATGTEEAEKKTGGSTKKKRKTTRRKKTSPKKTSPKKKVGTNKVGTKKVGTNKVGANKVGANKVGSSKKNKRTKRKKRM